MDDFVEYLVKKKNTGSDTMLKVLIILGTIILSFIFLTLCIAIKNVSFIFLLLVAGAIYGAWWLITSFNVEYEYIVTNGEMDIDKIVAQRKRKRLVTVRFKDMDIMAPVGGSHKNECRSDSVQKTIEASVTLDGKGSYFIITRNDKMGMIRIIFSPDDRIIKSAKTAAPRKVFTD